MASSSPPVPRFVRKFGPTLSETDSIVLDDLLEPSLCCRELGPVRINCTFRLLETQWGVLGVKKHPAVILYMDLKFHQSMRCRLESAVVSITLEELDAASTGVFERLAQNRAHTLQLAPYYGPRELIGEPTLETITQSKSLVPEVNILGQGVGGIGVQQEIVIPSITRWIFKGYLVPASHPVTGRRPGSSSRHTSRSAQAGAIHRTIKWELEENINQPQPGHSSDITTAFTIQHTTRPFNMRLDIHGKLQSWSKRRKTEVMQWFKFSSESRRSQGSALVFVQPDTMAKDSLDENAHGLRLTLVQLNRENTRAQLSDAMPASYAQAAAQPPPNQPSVLIDPALDVAMSEAETLTSTLDQ